MRVFFVNCKAGRCTIAEHVVLRFPLTPPLICISSTCSALVVTAGDSPSCSVKIGRLSWALPLQLTNDSSREASAGLLVPPPALNNEAKQNEDGTADTIMCSPGGLAAGAAKTSKVG